MSEAPRRRLSSRERTYIECVPQRKGRRRLRTVTRHNLTDHSRSLASSSAGASVTISLLNRSETARDTAPEALPPLQRRQNCESRIVTTDLSVPTDRSSSATVRGTACGFDHSFRAHPVLLWPPNRNPCTKHCGLSGDPHSLSGRFRKFVSSSHLIV